MKTAIIIFFSWTSTLAPAQLPTWNETVKQEKTQRKYSAEQLAALKAYAEVLKKGYGIVQKGLNEVGSSKNGTYLRDQHYFNSLKEVSPVVKNSPRIKEIYFLQQEVRDDFFKLNYDCRTDKNFTPSEVTYISKIYSNMIRQCEASLDELMLVASSSTEMSDAIRLQRLDHVAASMREKFEFTQHFIGTTRTLSLERAKEKNQILVMKKLHGKP